MTATEIGRHAADRLIHTITETMTRNLPDIVESFEVMQEALKQGNTVFACGNGGSAASAQHFIAELVGRYKLERGALPGIALGTNMSSITAIGNDYGYDQVFAREIEAYGKRGDVLVGFSTSGKSPNVLAALRAARARGMDTIAVTGVQGLPEIELADIQVAASSSETARIQEVHDLVIHIWCEALDASLGKDNQEG